MPFSQETTADITGPPENPGIIPRLVDDLFRESAEVDYSVELSYLEIYNERIRDLLSNEKGGPNGVCLFVVFAS
ncbi:hypothetical protein X801_09570 [Opisthorchis viverrini]|uniref:Kinesin motor domain-containing protein n=1 Tax=Opisthorchis viverrini TaxID=6198 RepID=A0A1S8WJL9_OPIVI|nr:hypothetical protein X801_09570 [Opisthorchis viverrini]